MAIQQEKRLQSQQLYQLTLGTVPAFYHLSDTSFTLQMRKKEQQVPG